MILIENATKKYGSLLAVDHLSLKIDRELFILLGPNGAGKTTTVKMLTGLLKPDSGQISVNGIDITERPLEGKKQFGYVPEYPNLYDKLTPREFIDFIIKVYNTPVRHGIQRMEQLFDIFEISDRQNELIEDLSNGMKKKVSLVAALVHQPKVLFLDEPTVALDPKAARHLKDMLRGLIGKGVTVLMTTHILEVAETMCDRIGIINKGQLSALGTLNELRRSYGQDRSLEDIFLKITGEAKLSKVDEFLQSE